MATIKFGRYRHFKGGLYEVLGEAKHSESLKDVVLYKYASENTLWVRPKKMFLEKVLVNGRKTSRFRFLGK
jgi:hypothetical protein